MTSQRIGVINSSFIATSAGTVTCRGFRRRPSARRAPRRRAPARRALAGAAGGRAGALLRAAGDLFGGWASTAGNSAYDIQRSVGGKAHDDALAKAVEEGKQHFHQCSRCGRWVCPEVCWNANAVQCEECAPDYQEELASSHANAKAEI